VTEAMVAAYPNVHTLKNNDWFDRPSLTAYWFGAELYNALGVPIGIVNEAVDGSSIFSWLGRTADLDADPAVQTILSRASSFGGLYRRKIAPLQPMAIAGVVWWQGEKDSNSPTIYTHLLPALIRSWREEWGQGTLPFLFVQLPTGGGLRSGETPSSLPSDPSRSDFQPHMRNAFFKALDLPRTGMVISTDLSGGTHPRNKHEYGKRLALLARAIAYGEEIVYSGPIFEAMAVEGNTLRLRFRRNTGENLVAMGSETLQGFAVAGANDNFFWAQARIEGSEVVVSSDSVSRPVTLRYGWSKNIKWANLFNGDLLAASPFSVPVISVALPTFTSFGTSTPTLSPTVTGTPTITLTPSLTATPPFTPTPSLTASPSQTPLATSTPLSTRSPTRSATITPSATITLSPTRTPTPRCPSGIVIGAAKVRVYHDTDPAGDESFKLHGQLQLGPLRAAVDPAANGFNFTVTAADGGVLFSRAIPPGLGTGRLGPGWFVNSGGSKWTYRDLRGAALGGVTQVTVIDHTTQTAGLIEFSLSAKGNFQIAPNDLPPGLTVILGGAQQAAFGQCGSMAFNPADSARPFCKLLRGTFLSCH